MCYIYGDQFDFSESKTKEDIHWFVKLRNKITHASLSTEQDIPNAIYSRLITNSNEYRELMRYLSSVRMSLTELVSSDQDYYDFVKGKITARAQSVKIYEMLDQCRDIIVGNKPGANVLRYLLHKMNNRIIKWQYSNNRCDRLSNLYLNYGCIPFDCMPYCTSLLQHNPRIYDLFESIPASEHEHELFARYIKNNTEIDGHLFTPRSEIEGFEDIDDLIREYNSSLYYKHNGRRIEEYKNHLYIKSYVKDSTEIIEKLQELASSGVSQYTSSGQKLSKRCTLAISTFFSNNGKLKRTNAKAASSKTGIPNHQH